MGSDSFSSRLVRGLDGERRGRGKEPGQGTRKPCAPADSSLSVKTVTHTRVLSRSRAGDQAPLQGWGKEEGAAATGVSAMCVLQLNPTDSPHPEGAGFCAPTPPGHLAAPALGGCALLGEAVLRPLPRVEGQSGAAGVLPPSSSRPCPDHALFLPWAACAGGGCLPGGTPAAHSLCCTVPGVTLAVSGGRSWGRDKGNGGLCHSAGSVGPRRTETLSTAGTHEGCEEEPGTRRRGGGEAWG